VTRLEQGLAIALVLVAISLHVFFVTHAGGLWRDEVSSLTTVSGSWSDQARLLEFESFPTVWPIVLRGWIAAGGGASDATLRVFGALGGLCLVTAVWFVLRRLGGTVPLISLALVAVNPEIVRWGASVRAWSVGAALILVVIVVAWEAAQRWSARHVIFAAGVAVAATQTVYQNLVLVAASIGCAMAVALSRRAWQPLAALGAIAVLCALSLLPYLGIIARRRDWNRLSETPQTIGALTSRLWEVLQSAGWVVAAIWIAALVVAAVCLTRPSAERAARTYAISVCALSTGVLLIFYLLFRLPTQRWYYVSLAAIIAVTAETVIVLTAGVRLRRLRMILAILVVFAGIGPTVRALQRPQTNVDVLARHLFANATPADLVVVFPWVYGVSFTYYDRGPADAMTIPPLADVHAHRYDLLKSAMLDPDALQPLLERLQSVLSAGGRVWVVGELPRVPPFARISRLGPPPLLETGWSSDPYEASWSQEVSRFFAAHATSRRAVEIPEGRDALEAPALTVFEGWK
jgi:uncharacterized membrane protein HdeD (DUF308 family)